ncbi:MAG TPA: biopolymer transporter ExbD [Polyangiales bacterium]
MAFGGSSKGVKNDINVTPLVDVVLVLLIIFMVIMPQLQRQDVKLPKAGKGDDNKEPDALIITLPADHTIWLDNKLVQSESLRSMVAAGMTQAPGRKILIKGDESLTVGDVRKVVTEAEAAGARGVSLAVEQAKQR